jgi:type IV pilus assembly protein PilQ
MRKWTKTAGLLFVAASAALGNQGVLAQAAQGTPAAAGANDPFANGAAPTSQPAGEATGQSVTDAQVNVSEEGTVEIHVNDANLNEVLRMLSLQLQKNILPSKEVRGTVTANLYDVTVREALDAILKANGFDYREKGNVIYVYTAKEVQDMEKANRVTKTEVFRLFYTPAANAAVMIKPVISPDAQVAMTTAAVAGIQSDSTDNGGNSHSTEDILVVTDYPERLDQVRRVLREIDKKPQQVLVEATIMRATLQDDNALGIDFTAVGGVDFTTLNNTQPGNWTTPGLANALSGQILDDIDAGRVLDNGYGAINAGGNGLKVGLVKNNIGLFITALEGITDTVIMANPKVLVLNKQKGSVHVGSEQGYRTAITTETATADNVKFLEVGTRLNFRPFIGENGNIRMEIQPEDSSGAVNAQGLPNKSVTKVTSNVMVKDGHTIVIGGLFREQSSSTRSQVPGLGSLPVIGGLFGKRTDATVREEVIILLTPHLIKDDDAYSELSEEQARNAERMRVGMRTGMMWFGRERLADGHYRDAVKDVERGRRSSALWHLNAALNLNPKFAEAADLKARVQGSDVTAADNSSIRSFLTAAIIRDRAATDGGTTQPADQMTPAPARGASITATKKQQAAAPAPQADSATADAGTEQAEQPATKPAKKSGTKATAAAPTGDATGSDEFGGQSGTDATTPTAADPLEGPAGQE